MPASERQAQLTRASSRVVPQARNSIQDGTRQNPRASQHGVASIRLVSWKTASSHRGHCSASECRRSEQWSDASPFRAMDFPPSWGESLSCSSSPRGRSPTLQRDPTRGAGAPPTDHSRWLAGPSGAPRCGCANERNALVSCSTRNKNTTVARQPSRRKPPAQGRDSRKAPVSRPASHSRYVSGSSPRARRAKADAAMPSGREFDGGRHASRLGMLSG
jgi:hypothetical protein